MSQQRRLTHLALVPWMVAGIWVWLWPAVIVGWWLGSQSRIGWATGIGQAVGALLAVLGLRVVGAVLYNATSRLHRGIRLVQDGSRLVSIPVGDAAGGLAALAVPFGLGMAIVVNLFGWAAVIPEHWLWMFLLLPLACWGYGVGSVWLYTHLVVVFYNGLDVELAIENGRGRLLKVSPVQARFVSAMLFFSWVMIVLMVAVLTLMALLTVLAHRVPAGWFGVEVALFTLFLLAGAGFLAAAAVGWWYYWGTRLYARWVRWGGGLVADVEAVRVSR
ncbi:MAG: hypothetical protein M0Z53_08035 [Thermaerobacter sp.]|nr:hypothetical protein [Thermaerobacter sp.]